MCVQHQWPQAVGEREDALVVSKAVVDGNAVTAQSVHVDRFGNVAQAVGARQRSADPVQLAIAQPQTVECVEAADARQKPDGDAAQHPARRKRRPGPAVVHAVQCGAQPEAFVEVVQCSRQDGLGLLCLSNSSCW